MKQINFEEITLRLDYSRRGGGIEIDLETLGFPGAKMTAYQNYLGGGMLGKIGNDCSHPVWREPFRVVGSQDEKDYAKLKEIATQLSKYFHALTNEEAEDYDEWNSQSFEQNQNMPSSAY